jgi:hypothetical protein
MLRFGSWKALEGYRTELLSESAVRQMLGFQTRMEVHAFLKQHGVYLHYDVSDLEARSSYGPAGSFKAPRRTAVSW